MMGTTAVKSALIGRLYLHYNVEFWIIVFTDDGVFFSYQGESFRNVFLRNDVKLDSVEAHIDLDTLMAKNRRNYFLRTDEITSVNFVPPGYFRKAQVVIEKTDKTKLRMVIGQENAMLDSSLCAFPEAIPAGGPRREAASADAS